MKKKVKENPKTIQESLGEKFDYYIDRLHCRGTKNRRIQYRDMCVDCREASYHTKTLKILREQVMAILDSKTSTI